jgi:hypothetical protein
VLLQAEAGALTLNAAVDAGGGSVSVVSSGAQTYAAAGDVMTTAGTIDVQATGASSTIGMNAGAVFRTGGGNIRLMAGTVDGAGATVNAGGSITVGVLDARTAANRTDGLLTAQANWGSVSVVSTGGSILDNASDASVNVYANGLRLTASGSIGALGATTTNALETEAATLSARAGSGGISLAEATALTVGTVTAVPLKRVTTTGALAGTDTTDAAAQAGLVSTSGSNGAVVLVSGGALTVSDVVTANGSGNVRLETTAGNLALNAALSSGTGHVTVIATAALTQSAAGDITTGGAGTVDVEAGTSITMTNGADGSDTVVTAAVDIRYQALGGDLALGRFVTGTGAGTGGTVVLTASGSVTDGDAGTDVTADQLYVQAGSAGGIAAGADLLETSVNTLALSAGSGGAFVQEASGLTVGAVSLSTLQRVATTGVVSAQTGNGSGTAGTGFEDLNTSDGGALVLTVTAGDLTVNGGTATAGSGVTAAGAGHVLLQAVAGALTLNAAVDAGGGSVSVVSSGAQTYAAAGDVMTTAGTIDVQATGAGSTIGMAAGTVLQTAGGNIRVMAGTVDGAGATVNAGGSITVGVLDARTAANRTDGLLTGQAGWGSVSVVSTGGSILDNAGDTAVNVYANQLRLNAVATAAAMGSGTNHLELEVARLSAAAGSGGMFLTEATAVTVGQTAALVVNRVKTDGAVTDSTQTDAAQSNLISGAALVLQTTDGAITTETTGAVTATGNLLLKAGGATSDLTLGAAVTNTASGGHISLDAGQDVLQNANVLAQTSARTIDVLAGRHITMAQGVSIASNDGNVLLHAVAGNVTLETITAGTAGVSISAVATTPTDGTAGQIIDGDTADDAVLDGSAVDITAGGLILRAGRGVGAGSNHLETDLGTPGAGTPVTGTLSASAGAAGLFVTERHSLVVDALTVAVSRVGSDGTVPGTATGTATLTQQDLTATGGRVCGGRRARRRPDTESRHLEHFSSASRHGQSAAARTRRQPRAERRGHRSGRTPEPDRGGRTDAGCCRRYLDHRHRHDRRAGGHDADDDQRRCHEHRHRQRACGGRWRLATRPAVYGG